MDSIERIRESARRRLEKRLPGATCTFFPMPPSFYQVFSKDHRPIGDESPTYTTAIESALSRAEKS